MLSPGKDYRLIPRERFSNLKAREAILREADRSRAFQLALIEACRQDIILFVNAFIFQFNPTKPMGEEVGPFILWEWQDDLLFRILEAIERNENLWIEKSREMGASWLCLIVQVWLWLFHPWQKVLNISKDADAVDKPGDADSLFWKIDFIISMLPDWLRPAGYRTDAPAKASGRTKMVIGNRDNNSAITGASSTGGAGVGGRAKLIFLDEFSKVKEDYEMLRGTASTANCRIFNGTHQGLDTAFYDQLYKERAVPINKVQIHWTQHPEKRRGLYRFDTELNDIVLLDPTYEYPSDYEFVRSGHPTGGPFPGVRSPWYDKKCLEIGGAREVAMELDIDPQGSSHLFFDPVTIRYLLHRYSTDPIWRGDIKCDEDTGELLGLVENRNGPLAMWVKPDHRGRVPPRTYVIGGDIATGNGATPSCFSVGSDQMEMVAEYCDARISPKDLAPKMVALAWLFSDAASQGAKLVWEQQGPGVDFTKWILSTGYRNLWYRRDDLRLSKTVSDKPGWPSTRETKPNLLREYRYALEKRQLLNPSRESLTECFGYSYLPDGSIECVKSTAEEGPSGARDNHGDRCMSAALMWMLLKDVARQMKSEKKELEPYQMVGTLAWRRKLAEDADRRQSAWA